MPNRPARKNKVKPSPLASADKIEMLHNGTARVVWNSKTKALPDRITAALSGDLGIDQKHIAAVGLDLVETLLRKNRDYGSSAFESPVLSPDLRARKALMVRMSDKVKRIAQLQKTGTAEVQESLEDTIKDLAGYCLLWLVCPE